jgi:hypothetical protein
MFYGPGKYMFICITLPYTNIDDLNAKFQQTKKTEDKTDTMCLLDVDAVLSSSMDVQYDGKPVQLHRFARGLVKGSIRPVGSQIC